MGKALLKRGFAGPSSMQRRKLIGRGKTSYPHLRGFIPDARRRGTSWNFYRFPGAPLREKKNENKGQIRNNGERKKKKMDYLLVTEHSLSLKTSNAWTGNP